MKRPAYRLSTLIAALAVGCSMATAAAQRPEPVLQLASTATAQQNAILRAHCVVCHTSAKPAGGLVLDTFDLARPDPGIARMLRVKIVEDAALGAAGIPQPDAATIDALVHALAAASEQEIDGIGRWRAYVAEEGRSGYSLITVRIVQPAQRRGGAAASAAYELTLTCGGRSREGNVSLGRHVTNAVSGPVPTNSAEPVTGPAFSVVPAGALTVQPTGFPDEHVTFPFADLTPAVRHLLTWCFNGGESVP